VGETAKFLPACKAAPSTTFTAVIVVKVVLGEPQEGIGNNTPRYMTILHRIRLIHV